MLPRTGLEYLFLGFVHIELQTVSEGRTLRYEDHAGPLDRLDWYLDQLLKLGLSTTTTAAWPLQIIRERLSTLPADSLLSEADAEKIRSSALMLRETLKAELTNLTVYEVSGKRFDTKALLTNLPSLMRTGVYRQLPLIAGFDLHEAATCIAFERPTAAAFHSLRAAEAVLRQYYRSVVRQKRLNPPWMWGPMVRELRKPRRVRKPNGAVLDHLDSIRKNFRNPTQHPDKIYDNEEAQNLFGQCLAVIEAMIGDGHWETPGDAIELKLPALANE
jgi:hypothetical protein